MSHQEHLDELLETINVKPFEYDPESANFVIADQHIAVKNILEPRHVSDQNPFITSGLMVTDYNLIVQTPPMTEWLRGGPDGVKNDDFDEAIDVMARIYTDQTGQKIGKILKGDHLHGFGAGLQRLGHPTLSVLGNCACFGVVPHGMFFGEDEWPSGYAQYEPHNIEWPAQLTTLLAGAGVLARRYRQSQIA